MTLDSQSPKQWTERIKMRLKELSMTQDTLAAQMGVTRGAIAHYLSGRRVPPLNQFQKMAKILQVEPAWLQFGVYPSYDGDFEKGKSGEEKRYSRRPRPIPLLTWRQIVELPNVESIDGLKTEEYIPHLYTDKIGQYGLRVQGDAMTAPSGYMVSFREGDIIQVDQAAKPKHNDYVVVVLEGAKEATFRQYIIDSGVPYLKPINPQFPLIEMDGGIRFCGVVVYHIAKSNLG